MALKEDVHWRVWGDGVGCPVALERDQKSLLL